MAMLADEIEKLRAKVSHPEVVAALRKVHSENQGGDALTERRRRRSRDVAAGGGPRARLRLHAPAAGTTTARTASTSPTASSRTATATTTRSTAAARTSGTTAAARRTGASSRARRSAAAIASRPPTSPRTPAAAASAPRRRRAPRASAAPWPRTPPEAAELHRIDVEPRQGWPAIIEEQGLIYWKTELPDGSMMPYWNESNAYTLTSDEVYEMEASRPPADGDAGRGRRLHHRVEPLLADGHPRLGGAAHQGDVGVRAADALRALRLRLRPGRLQDARVQRGHADRAGRDRRPVALGAGRLRRRRRPVEHGPRAARRSAGRSCSRACPATARTSCTPPRRTPARTS